MSKMGVLGAIGFSLALLSLTQIPCSAAECRILSATTSGPSSILVKWDSYPGATNYFLDLREKNVTNIAPVVVSMPASVTQKDVKGLKPGVEYTVTLKVFQFYHVVCATSARATTAPDKTHITAGVALSSTAIMVNWTAVPSADHYYLLVYSQDSGEHLNLTYNKLSAVVGNLKPSTNYDCYVYTSNQAGIGEKSKVRTITTLVEPPLGLKVQQTGMGTARVSWDPVEDVLLYRVIIQDVDEPDSTASVYNVTDTKLDVNGILPCSTYLVSVSSFNIFLVPSESTTYSYTTNKLKPVQSISVDYSCTTNSVQVSWTAVFGAETYRAMVVDRNGEQLSCSSQDTTCVIPNLSCSETYVVNVIPMLEGCTHTMNSTMAIFETNPCPPKNLELLRDCSSEVVVFSWEHTNSTDHYLAKAVDNKGQVQECLTADNSCYFTHTVCGRHYHFTVYSIKGMCRSQISATVDIRTAPCVPQNMQTSSDCNSNLLLSKWDLAEGALRYTVEVFGNKGNQSHYNCTSMSDSCAMTGVQCGEYLSVFITAFDDECASPRIMGPPTETVPCAPKNVAAVKECGADSITIAWSTVNAIFYVAMLEDSMGTIHTCNSMDTTCKIDGLKCSTNYTASVVASNLICNSSQSEAVIIETAACPPDHVMASLDCAANEALISWHGRPKMNSFTATIIDEDQGLLSCSSTNTSCRVPNLKCGKLYTVSVSHHDGICPSLPSEAIYFESVPCGPRVNTVNIDCQTQVLTLDWNGLNTTEGYITEVSNSDQRLSFRTTEPELTVDTLECGFDYTLKVMSFNGSCVGQPSVLHVGKTPCVPTGVAVSAHCGQSFANVTWRASRGALSYQAVALDQNGQQLQCSSSETTCSLSGLMCSQVYSVGVMAMDNSCTSNTSDTEMLRTVPCPPTILSATVNCADNSAMLTWSSSPNAVSYTGKAVSQDGHTVTCDAGLNLDCQLTGLQCGKRYIFTVSASDGTCQSPDSEPVMRTTAPCVVQNVVNTLDCNTNTLTVSWTPGLLPVNYTATAMSQEGTALVCTTETSSCTLTNLKCGEQYIVTVRAISSTCTGNSSLPEIVNSVPCVPVNVRGLMDCATNTLTASWNKSAGAMSYISTLMGAGGFSSSCPTVAQSCLFPALQCAQTYMLSVVAVNDRCNSSKSAVVSSKTAPCDPTNVAATLDCPSGVATVTWSAGGGADYYTVLAEANGHHDSCRSTSTSCELTQLQCGQDYTVTVLAGDAKCNSSMQAKTNLTTAPCAPVIEDHSLDCVTNHAKVTWAEDKNAKSVLVNATSSQGGSVFCSSSTNTSCVLDKLMCGNTYTVYAVARGERCFSEPSSSFEIVTAPCTPANVESTYSCDSNVALLSWDETLGRQSFYAKVFSGDHMVSCSTTEAGCSLPPLRCGRNYTVEVISVADHCNSSVPGVTRIQTAPCAPTNVSAYLVCKNNTVAVSWQPSQTAKSYKVIATGRDGDVKECSTNKTSCHIPNMHCDQTYVITVTPYSGSCRGFISRPLNYVAGPCPPTNVQVRLQCEGNLGFVTWTPARKADLYVATASHPDDDHNHTCSSNGTGCTFTDLHCSETAVVTVVTMERGCMSEPSEPFTFKTVICPPTGVTGVTTCENNDITVSWDQSPDFGVTYFIHTQEAGGTVANYTTIQMSRVLTGLQCGQLYTLKVAAANSQCPSVFSEPIQTATAPCPPTNLTAKGECGSNLGIVNWAPSIHAVSYTATITGTHGHVTSCSSNTTTCSAKLECGQQYSVAVVASSNTCDSSVGTSLTFDSAPCLPDRISADLNCNANSFAVQWRATSSDMGIYTAIAIASDNSRVSCDSTSTDCVIQNLKCGYNYSIAVTTSSVDCGTIEGSDYSMLSAPCKPENVLVNLQCSTNTAMVTWANSGPDQTQIVSATASRGAVTKCNSSSSNCTFNQLSCGEMYAITVVGHTDTCQTEPAAAAEILKTAPCVPTHVTARVDCQTGITSVTWDAALGATSYTVYARDGLGGHRTCNSTDTNCNFLTLQCGQDYTITVLARHDSCVSLISESVNITTAPCEHNGLKTSLDCQTNTVMVSWTPGRGILYYNASADSFNTVHMKGCSTNGTSCNISSLHCGESYRVSVSGQGEQCPSPSKSWHRVPTAPCPPTNLTVVSSCQSNDISVSWQSSKGSVSYRAVAEDAQGRQWTCNTNSTSCQISDLLCGQAYQVYAVGVDDKCDGAKSNIKNISTAPCVPHDVQNNLDCLSGVLNITWQSTGHFVQFHTSVVSSKGNVVTCKTHKHQCVVRNMQCGLTYNVTVVAQDEFCNSSNSPIKQVLTAPCPLKTFHPTINCTTGVVSVTWNNGVPGVKYTVFAADESGHRHNCSSTNGGCGLSTLMCGTEYNITITPSRDECVGRDSPTKMIMTVPCIPRMSEVEIDCLANSAWVMYEMSAGAQEYAVVTKDSQGMTNEYQCNATSDGICNLPELKCSQNLTFTIQARDQTCSSAPSNAITAETAPCPPSDVESTVDCHTDTASISWSAVPGALSYTATLEQVNGNTSCCTSSDTSCDISDLLCGEMYVLLVVAEGRTCNSSQSEGRIVKTAPCDPQNLQASLSCSNNVASMTWNTSNGVGHLYRVRAVDTEGHRDECVSVGNECDLTGLLCGQYYTAEVVAEDSSCTSEPSNNVTIKTVPCTPENVSSVMDCEANTLIVSWSESSGADSYIATLQDSDVQITTCQGTTEGSCSVPGVGCGQIYHVSVVASDGYCDSPPTPVVDTPSVPCKPTHIKAVMDCTSKSAMVGWFPCSGAAMYVVTATSASDHSVTCKSNISSCTLEKLTCGQTYSVSVEAVGQSCNTSANMTEQLVTEPCVPGHITTRYTPAIGQVLWDNTAGADYYTVEAMTEQGLMVSCETNDTYCPLYSMQCGQIYSLTVTAENGVCQGMSTSTEDVSITTEPCPPNDVQTHVQCESDEGTVSWESSVGAVAYEARLAGRDGHALSCYTNGTFCNVEGLHCGVIYYTNVIAIGQELNSSLSATALLVGAPCEVENVAVDVDCDNNTAEVSWSPSGGASSYKVTAVSASSHRVSCKTDEHQCDLSDLECGQTYNVRVTAISDSCQTETHSSVTFSSRPCKPMRVGADLQCGTSTADMYWEEAEGVELYIATASDSMGMTLQCNTTNSTCQFSNLHCGETYELSVTAYGDKCSSEISQPVFVQTDPCQPTGLSIEGTCNNDTVTVAWAMAKGASAYVMTASGDLGFVTSFQTNDTTIEADLACGQLYTFTVKAQDGRCDSPESQPEVFRTGPCVPQHVQSFTHCENNLGAVSWAKSDGAEFYIAVAMGEDGHTHLCYSNTTTCTWDDLHCGDHYTVFVVADDYMCTSEPGNTTSIRMAPCVPENLESSLDCTTKAGLLTWNATETAEYYIVTAEANVGHKVQFSTNETAAVISELLCGEEYFLSVQAADSECTSRPSPPITMNSVPCPPTGVSSFMNCLSNIAVVSWLNSAGAEFYTATVTQEDGESASCWSDSTECGIPNLNCGQNYSVTVVASDQMCMSDPTEGDTLPSVPCVPTDVNVTVECSQNQAVVSWSASDGALSYKVSARSSQGDMALCETTDLMCTLTNLTCGETYSVQVVAEDDICSSLPSPVIEFNSVPCIPAIGSVVLDCYTDSALLDWSYTKGAMNYTAIARSTKGDVVTCSSNFTHCELMDLQCGETYIMVAIATNDRCSSPPSSRLQTQSVPCPPQGVSHVVECNTNSALVRWEASSGAESYIAQAFGIEEHESSCETDSLACIIPDLECGFTYNISVLAVNSLCNISRSTSTQLNSVPCVPQHVHAHVNCETGDVAVSWESSKGATSYTAFAQSNSSLTDTSCVSNDTTCLFSDLLCGLNYSITVSAMDDQCSSPRSSPVEISTVPCDPQQVSAQMVCDNDTGVVTWEKEADVSSYKVEAFGPDSHRIMCSSTTNSCQLPDMHCGQLYNLTVTAQDGRCDNSVTQLNLQSVPCKPTSVMASLQCQANIVSVSWTRANGAQSYKVVGVSADGSHRSECHNNMTWCDLSDLQCGQTYNVSVFSLDDSCSSMESDKTFIQTAPCAPQDVVVNSYCDDGEIIVSWSEDSDVQFFHVTAVSNTMAIHRCTSIDTSCTISNLPCGQHYNITVMAERDSCDSPLSTMVQTSSVPCVPQRTKAHLDCVTNSAWVTWEDTAGALSYSVLAVDAVGHNSSCTSTVSPCEVPDLKCGTLYTFHVTAANNFCQSNHSETFQFETGPCALKSIDAVTECNSDMILVEWEGMGNTTLYAVTAEAQDKSTLSCDSSSTSCILENIVCDMHYSIIVSTSSDKCSSLRSPPKKVTTAPCVPANVTTVLSCEDKGAIVTWGHSPVALSYVVRAVSGDGHMAGCDTPVNNCTLSDLQCGQTYTLTITGVGENCTSNPSTSSFKTAPCGPSSVAVDVDCETSKALLTWDPLDGAVKYFGSAESMEGDTLYCDSTITSCTIHGLVCGRVYNFSVGASNGICNGSFSAPVQMGAAPCAPTGIKVRMQRIDQAHWAMVSWDKVNCSYVEYLVEIIGRIDDNPQTLMDVKSYWLPRPYFEFPMPCSTSYQLTVRSRNSGGVSEPSSIFTGVTVPCAPQNFMYTGDMQSAVLHWDASLFATRYTVYNETSGGRVALCSTTGLSCQLTNFDPGTAEVTASNAVGESLPNRNITGPGGSRRRRDLRATQVLSDFDDGLEVPQVLTVIVRGVSLYVNWTTVKDASEYTLVIEEEQREQLANEPPRVRTVEGNSYIETDLKPWTTYCIRLAARNTVEQSNYSKPKCTVTGAS